MEMPILGLAGYISIAEAAIGVQHTRASVNSIAPRK